jgi:hypothetical protein
MKSNFDFANPDNCRFELLPEYIEETFTKIENTVPGILWTLKNPNMEAQYVFEKLIVFGNQLKNLKQFAKNQKHHDLIDKALIQVDEWQKYVIDIDEVNQSKRYFADDILHGSDKNPNLLTGAN